MRRFALSLAFLTPVLMAIAPVLAAIDQPVVDYGPFMVFFDSGSRAITSPARSILDNAAQAMAERPQANALIEGHSDRAGPPGDNRRLSCARALAARTYLMSRGVAPERMAAVGHGEDRLLRPTADGVAMAENRRVELVFGTREQVAAAAHAC